MKESDFLEPRRMSKRALVILLIKSVKAYASVFFVFFMIKIYDFCVEKAFWEIFLLIPSVLGAFLLLAFTTAFLSYYFKKFYIEDGSLIFMHGVIQRERTTVPLHKIYTLRTRRGLIYRLLDMRGVSFDTLASGTAEIELILDEYDWNVLLGQVETQSKGAENTFDAINVRSATNAGDERNIKLNVSNLNLIKGALCQNHLKGMVVLLGVLGTLYNQTLSVNEEWVKQFIDNVDTYAETASFSYSVFAFIVAALYLVVLLLWMGKVFLRYYRMDIQLNEKQLFFESGLLTRNSSRFSYDKICTVSVKRNVVEQWMGCCTVLLKQALFATDKEKGGNVNIYGCDHEEHFLRWWLGKDYSSSPDIISARSGYGLLGHSIKYELLIFFSVSLVLCYYGQYAWLMVTFSYLLIVLLKGALAVRRSYITLKEDYLEVGNGKFARMTNYFKYGNIEVVRLVATPFTPYFHRVSLLISTNGTSFRIRSLREQEAKDIYERLLFYCERHKEESHCAT